METIRRYYDKLSRKILVNFVSGGGALVSTIVNSSFMKYYTDIIGLGPALFGAVYAIYSIWNALNDPLIGIWTDKAAFIEGKGKYKRMIRKAIPLITVPVIAILLAQPSWEQVWLAIYLLIFMVIYEGAQTLLNVSFIAFTVNTFISSDERTKMSTVRTYVEQIPVFAAGAVPMIFLTGDFSNSVIVAVFTATVIFGMVIVFIGHTIIKEDKGFYDHIEVTHGFKELWQFFVESLKSKAFIIYLIASILINIATGNYFVGYLYYMDNVLLVEGLWVVIPDVLTGVGQMIILPFIIGWARKYGVRNTLANGYILSLIGHFILFFDIGYWVAAPIYILILLGYAFSSALRTPIQALVIDDLELKTRKRQPGMLGGIMSVFLILATSIQILIISTLLSSSGYNGEVKVQTPEVVKAIRTATGLIPTIILLVGILILFTFPIGKLQEGIIHQKIIEKHDEKPSVHID